MLKEKYLGKCDRVGKYYYVSFGFSCILVFRIVFGLW